MVQLKVSQTDGLIKRSLLEIIDLEDSLIYGEEMAQETFLAIIKAIISHQLNNPLTIIISEILASQKCFKDF